MTFAEYLQDKMLKSKKTRKEFAKLAVMPKHIVDDFCNGVIPTSWEIGLLSNALGVIPDEIEWVIYGDNEQTLDPIKRQSGIDLPLKQAPNQLKKDTKLPPNSKKKLVPPGEKHCRKCDIETGTECYRHVESRVIKFLDKGGIMGGKVNDNLTAWLCFECDQKLSSPVIKKETPSINDIDNLVRDHALAWALAIIKTHLI